MAGGGRTGRLIETRKDGEREKEEKESKELMGSGNRNKEEVGGGWVGTEPGLK